MLLLLTKESLMSVSLTEAEEKQINLFQVGAKTEQLGFALQLCLPARRRCHLVSLPCTASAARGCELQLLVLLSAWPEMGHPCLASTVLSGLTCKARIRAKCVLPEQELLLLEVSKQRSHPCSTACLRLQLCCVLMLPTQSLISFFPISSLLYMYPISSGVAEESPSGRRVMESWDLGVLLTIILQGLN